MIGRSDNNILGCVFFVLHVVLQWYSVYLFIHPRLLFNIVVT